MTDKELLELEEGTPIAIESCGFAKRLVIFTKDDISTINGVGYFIGNFKVPSSYVRLATKEDIETRYQERLNDLASWKNKFIKAIDNSKATRH